MSPENSEPMPSDTSAWAAMFATSNDALPTAADARDTSCKATSTSRAYGDERFGNQTRGSVFGFFAIIWRLESDDASRWRGSVAGW